jgi:hypothetical protein
MHIQGHNRTRVIEIQQALIALNMFHKGRVLFSALRKHQPSMTAEDIVCVEEKVEKQI